MHLKTSSKRLIQKAAEAIGDLISNKTANVVLKSQDSKSKISKKKITKVSKNLQEHNLETGTND